MEQVNLTMQDHIIHVCNKFIEKEALMHRTKDKNTCQDNEVHSTTFICLRLSVFIMISAGVIDIQKGRANESFSVFELKEIGIHIKTSEKKLHNLKGCAEVWLEKGKNPKDPCNTWQETPIYVKSIMWSDGQPGGKIKVDVKKQVLEGWITDAEPGPYSEHSFSDSFDGTTGRSIINSSGFLGKTVPIKEGVISTQKPQSLDDNWSFMYTGREFTTNFFRVNSQGTLLSDLFIFADDPNSKVMTCFEFTWEKLKGVECIKISSREIKNHNGCERWWLDPARGFALIRYEHTVVLGDKTEAFKRLVEIQELREVTEGVWWPIKATCITEPLRAGENYTRMVYHASEVVANDPNFNNNVFTIEFPRGYKIDNTITHKNYIVDANLNMIEEPNYKPKTKIIQRFDGLKVDKK
jgi:hypothetical protein